jgi:hypothetical protein
MFTAKVPARKFKAYITEVNMQVSAETKGEKAKKLFDMRDGFA